MSGKPYVVVRNGEFLRLVGPFSYPQWRSNLADAERMSFGKAAQCAAAFGGVAQPADAGFNAGTFQWAVAG